MLRFDGVLYFANTGYFEDRVLERAPNKPCPRYIVIDAEGINEIDATDEEMLHMLARRLETVGIELIFARAKRQVMDVLERTRFVQQIGEEHFTRLREQALDFARRQLDCKSNKCPLLVAVPRQEATEIVSCPAALRAMAAAVKNES